MNDGLKVQQFSPQPVKKPAVVVRNQRDLGDALIGVGLVSTFFLGLFMAWFGG
ncbi:hypothetical protein [Faecalibaculum rodentium]|uniref:hypothetical protein n=1 Tax=Faecalibaculum rodentium TaxID=1702221 RepID=UPI0023F44F77|nr:hypothetical protein [Faecalibaculum rodentium]